LVRLQEENPKFREFLEHTASEKGKAPLMGLLVTPLNHIAQYMIFLKTMLKNSPSNNRDLANLHNAYLAVKKTFKFIQESNSQSSNRAKMLDVHRRLTVVGFELVTPRRQFIREGPVTTLEKILGIATNKQRRFFLFSDSFILADELGKDKFRSLSIVMLKEATIHEVPAQKQAILTTAQNKQQITFFVEDKSELVPKLKELIQVANITGKVFGVPLAKLLELEKSQDGIPFVVKVTTSFLKLRKQTEGLFRISGGSEEVAQLKLMFNKVEEGTGKHPNLNTFSPHTVAGVLKMFFRELPEPLLTFEAYQPIIQIQALDVANVRAVIQKIPLPNQKLIKYLASFVCSIAQYEHLNKMGLNNLATVFGPNLIYAKEETLENILAIPKLNSAVRFIFQNYAEIFDKIT